MKMLCQLQLSNYTTSGIFLLECDSGYQMMMGRARVMLDLIPDLQFDILGPERNQLKYQPEDVNADLFKKYKNRLRYLSHKTIPDALSTRYDFDFNSLANILFVNDIKYDYVYMNDPMLLRSFRALFYIKGKHLPKFFVHSHFIDDPSCPKFPTEASLWMGQCEAARKADFNFWQCESSMRVFFDEMSKEYQPHVVEEVMKKSAPWDDGYSHVETTNPPDLNNLRFDVDWYNQVTKDKIVIFVPNRIGMKGRSSDYTNCGAFMFDHLPRLAALRDDYVVVCGNPSQKVKNDELVQLCGKNGYLNLVPDSLNRDEYKFIAGNSDIAVGLYNADSYGGTAARECVVNGCMPFWVDNYEYSLIGEQWNPTPLLGTKSYREFMVKPDLSDLVVKLNHVMNIYDKISLHELQKIIMNRCSYEKTTQEALRLMEIL